MNQLKLSQFRRLPGMPFPDRLLGAMSRRGASLLLILVCCGVALVGAFVIRDLRAANDQAQQIYTTSVRGLQQIGELQYEAQETRRATLYALTTTDSNRQVEYADQTREADQRVTDGIAEYAQQARAPEEQSLANRLGRDWADYLSVRDEVLASILEGSTKEAVTLDLQSGVPSFERVRRDLEEVKRRYAEDASRVQANLAASSRRSSSKVAGILGFTFLLSTAAVWAIQRSRMLSRMQLADLQMQFVASVSHELRTPLAVIRSAADNLADGIVRDQAGSVRYGGILQRQSRSMSDLIDQILLFASTEDRQSRYALQPLEVADVVHAVHAQMEPVLHAAGSTIVYECPDGLPPFLGDLTGVSRCLQNLIGNAIKYGGDDRRIAVRARVLPSGSDHTDELSIAVTDHGIGIDSSELAQIFEPFYRSPRVVAAQIHGTGLGLSLARRIAESMGARLTVDSQLSIGSTFTLHLQLAKGVDPTTAAYAGSARVSRI
jgi:signal transduction histidine kinase